MKRFLRRRTWNLLTTLVVTVAAVVALDLYDLELGRRSYLSGYVMFALVAFLAMFNIRKKFPMLPLGTASFWLQCHIYVGLVCGILFGVHVGWRLPNGALETALFVCFMMTFVSGLSGLYISRSTPKVLSRVGQEVVYERIPRLRRDMAVGSRRAVLEAVAASGSTTLADFYVQRLFDFFAAPAPLGYLLRPTARRRRKVMQELQSLDRYLNAQERSCAERLFGMIRQKDLLDFHQVRQRLLKVWLFLHIGLTCLLLVLATFHGIVALSFRGDSL